MSNFIFSNGKLSIENSPFIDGDISFNISNSRINSSTLNWIEENGSYISEYADKEFFLTIRNDDFEAGIKNNSDRDIFIDDISINFNSSLEAGDYYEFIHSQCFEANAGVKKVGIANAWLSNNPESSMVYMLKHIDQDECFMFGAVPPFRNDYTLFKANHKEAHLEGGFGITIRSDQRRKIPANTKCTTTVFTFLKGEDPLAMQAQLGERWKTAKTTPLKDGLTGWNSWDFFAGAVSSKDIFDNQEKGLETYGDALEYWVIDEGYEPRWGVWEANWKFPEGLDGYCKRITDKGGKPGVWTSALLVNTYTDLYRDNPDWFAKDKSGNIVQKLYSYGPMAYLDPTHPEVEAWLLNTFKKLKEAGFSYFKVDFTQEILSCDVFHDMTTGRGGIIRKCFDTIRKAIGEDSYLLACGAPYESVIGTVDAVRTSGDIHNFWGHVLRNITMFTARWWQHGKVWNNDPDFLIVRTKETSPGYQLNRPYAPSAYVEGGWLNGRELNLEEMKSYALAVYLTAGDIFLSDNLLELNEIGETIIKKVLERPIKNAAVPVDMFSSHAGRPGIWVAKEDNFTTIGLFNWEEDTKEITLNLEDHGIAQDTPIKSFWDNTTIQAENGVVKLKLKPRHSIGLVFEK